jgi:hypothetical protein
MWGSIAVFEGFDGDGGGGFTLETVDKGERGDELELPTRGEERVIAKLHGRDPLCASTLGADEDFGGACEECSHITTRIRGWSFAKQVHVGSFLCEGCGGIGGV